MWPQGVCHKLLAVVVKQHIIGVVKLCATTWQPILALRWPVATPRPQVAKAVKPTSGEKDAPWALPASFWVLRSGAAWNRLPVQPKRSKRLKQRTMEGCVGITCVIPALTRPQVELGALPTFTPRRVQGGSRAITGWCRRVKRSVDEGGARWGWRSA